VTILGRLHDRTWRRVRHLGGVAPLGQGVVKDLENGVRGVEKSRLARWYVRNRRAADERGAGTPTPTANPKE
jgi:hypothetical protein